MREDWLLDRRLLLAACLLVLAGAQVAAQPAGARASARLPEVSAQADKSLLVDAPSYQAKVGEGGNLRSFSVEGTELLEDQIPISQGAFLYSEGPLSPGAPTMLSSTIWEATGRGFAVQYRFLRKEIQVILKNNTANPLTYFVVLSAEVALAANTRTGEFAAAPAAEQWSDVRFTTNDGTYIELLGGTRIWGPWLGRQVWEISPIEPGKTATVRIAGGKSLPPEPALEDLIGLSAAANPPDGIVPTDQPMEIRVTINNRSDKSLAGLVSMELSGSRSDLLVTSSSPLQLTARQSTEALFRANLSAPDFYTARITLTAAGRRVREASAAGGYRVAEIAATTIRPDDFKGFWQRVVSDSRAAPVSSQMSKYPARSAGDVSTYTVEYVSAGGKKIHGWYVSPGNPGPHPALLYLAGYGARPISPPVALARHGYVVLAIDVRGNPVDQPRPRAFEDYCTIGIEAPETYVYSEIVAHCLGAISFLASREEVDPNKIAVVGISDGAGMGLMLAALDSRVRAVAAGAPMLCDFPLSLKAASWPYTEIANLLQEKRDLAPRIQATLSYFDLANFAQDVKCPVLLSVGFLDRVSLPAAVYGVFNAIPGPKEMKALPGIGHEGGGTGLWVYKLAWLERVLSEGP